MVNDKFYIDKILAGDKQYFNYIVENYKKIMFTLALRLIKNREEAEDLTQESFIKVYKNLALFDYRVKFSTWVYKIVYNTCIDYIRKQKMQFDRIDSDENYFEIPANDSIDFDYDFKKDLIQESLKELPSDYGFILTLFYFEELDINEIAEITEQNKSNIKIKLFRGRKLLETKLKRKLKDEIYC